MGGSGCWESEVDMLVRCTGGSCDSLMVTLYNSVEAQPGYIMSDVEGYFEWKGVSL